MKAFKTLPAIWLVCLLGLGSELIYARAQQASTPAPHVSTAITFRCLWWSDEQKNGLNPNAPPPKTTEVILKKWEYSDPIEVPHPDVVDVVVEIRNDSDLPAADLTVDVATRWRIGPLRNEDQATWGKATSAQRLSVASLSPRGTHTLRVPVNLAEKMKQLRPKRTWPWALRAQATATSAASGKILSTIEADLPITPGD
jgi:hypothetical protein